ncbi:MAG: cobalamin-dependent protein [Betaproteobacteria bacterium]|nr:cobalamin-dependent protein [Betaproteobacteria bacterium]
MRVLLVYSNQSRELVPAPPVGLSYVASATRAAGHEVRLLDLAFSREPQRELATAIAGHAPDVVGLSIRNIDNVVLQRFESPRAALLAQVRIIRECAVGKDAKPAPLVLGGPAVSILAERALEIFGADYAITGEGEQAFPALLSALESGQALEGIAGLCWRRNGVLTRNPTQLLPGFAHSGMEDWVAWGPYQAGGGTWPLQTKRGCSMRCSYCAYPLIEGRRGRQRAPGDVVDEIERVLHATGVQGFTRPRTFEFVDSTFNVPSAHAIAICEEIIRRGVSTNFTAMGLNPRDVPPELLPLMKRAGFNSVMITPEAGCAAMLENYRKGFTMADVETTLERVRASGLKSMWFFMLGAPGETMATCAESIGFARDRLAGRRFLSVFFTGIRVLPATELARQAVASGYLTADADLAEARFYVAPGIDEQQVIDLVDAAIARNPCIVHAAEGGSTNTQETLYRALHALGVAPPYWRFLPEMLSFPPLHFLRRRNPAVKAGRVAA